MISIPETEHFGKTQSIEIYVLFPTKILRKEVVCDMINRRCGRFPNKAFLSFTITLVKMEESENE